MMQVKWWRVKIYRKMMHPSCPCYQPPRKRRCWLKNDLFTGENMCSLLLFLYWSIIFSALSHPLDIPRFVIHFFSGQHVLIYPCLTIPLEFFLICCNLFRENFGIFGTSCGRIESIRLCLELWKRFTLILLTLTLMVGSIIRRQLSVQPQEFLL